MDGRRAQLECAAANDYNDYIMTYTILNRRLFIQKLTVLFLGTLLLIPLVYFKLQVPAMLYVGGLLLLHIGFLYLYFTRTPWRTLLKRRGELILRVVGVLFFIYLLTLIKFEGDIGLLVIKTTLALVVHAAILTAMMVERKP